MILKAEGPRPLDRCIERFEMVIVSMVSIMSCSQ